MKVRPIENETPSICKQAWSDGYDLYPIVIHKDPESTFGVTVPDLPGCFSAGDTLDEALRMSQEAIELHIEGLLEDNDAVPIPHSIDEHQKSTEFQGGIWALVDVDLDKLMGPADATA